MALGSGLMEAKVVPKRAAAAAVECAAADFGSDSLAVLKYSQALASPLFQLALAPVWWARSASDGEVPGL